MNWKMVFIIYSKREKRKLELTRYKLTDFENVKLFIKQFFEEQKSWIVEEENKNNGWGFEVMLVDEFGREIPIKNLYEIIHKGEEIMGFFSMTSDVVGEILVEGLS